MGVSRNAVLPAGDKPGFGQKAALWIFRAAALLAGMAMFFPPANPGRISEKINEASSLFTTGVSRGTITNSMGRILRSQWIQDADITLLMIACIVVMLGVIACAVGACMSMGNRKMRRRGLLFPLFGAPVMAAGLLLIRRAYSNMLAHGEEIGKLDTIKILLPDGFTVFCVFAGILFFSALAAFLATPPEKDPEVRMEMEEKYRLFLMMLPVILLSFIFAYLPIWGWRFAFFDYKPGGAIGADNYVGLKWFGSLFNDPATVSDLVRVLRYAKTVGALIGAKVRNPMKRGDTEVERNFFVHALKLAKSPQIIEIQPYGNTENELLELSFIQEVKVYNSKQP